MFSQTQCVILAIVITLTGVWVRWRLAALEMSAEERLKEGKLTPRQVERRLRWARDGGRLLTIAGLVLLGASVLMGG